MCVYVCMGQCRKQLGLLHVIVCLVRPSIAYLSMCVCAMGRSNIIPFHVFHDTLWGC